MKTELLKNLHQVDPALAISLQLHSESKSSLWNHRERVFPVNSVVRVMTHGRIFGIVCLHNLDDPSGLNVLVENGNIWRYGIEECEPGNPEWTGCPTSIKEIYYAAQEAAKKGTEETKAHLLPRSQ